METSQEEYNKPPSKCQPTENSVTWASILLQMMLTYSGTQSLDSMLPSYPVWDWQSALLAALCLTNLSLTTVSHKVTLGFLFQTLSGCPNILCTLIPNGFTSQETSNWLLSQVYNPLLTVTWKRVLPILLVIWLPIEELCRMLSVLSHLGIILYVKHIIIYNIHT